MLKTNLVFKTNPMLKINLMLKTNPVLEGYYVISILRGFTIVLKQDYRLKQEFFRNKSAR